MPNNIYNIVTFDCSHERAKEILDADRMFTDDELRKMLSGHLCRCTGYENIFRAVKKTMYRRQGKEIDF